MSTLEEMKKSRQWLLYQLEEGKKVPYYTNGYKRNGSLDEPKDLKKLDTYENALKALETTGFTGLGFALNNGWQGIDLDHIDENGLNDLAEKLSTIGYVERSPSKSGLHIIGHGKFFPSLSQNGSGIEAYSSGRYFTFTGDQIYDGPLVDLTDVAKNLIQFRIGEKGKSVDSDLMLAINKEPLDIDEKELDQYLEHYPVVDLSYNEWVEVGMMLHHQFKGDQKGLSKWMAWSFLDDRYKEDEFQSKWESFNKDPGKISITLKSLIHRVKEKVGKIGWKKDLEDLVKELNKSQVLTIMGGKTVIIKPNESEGFKFYIPKELVALHQNQKVQVGFTEKGLPIYKNIITAWLAHPMSSVFRDGLVFEPSGKHSVDQFNLWQGFKYQPIKNDALVKPFINHIENVLCDGIKELSDYVLNWIAYGFQNPAKPAEVAVVARGKKGSGKSTVGVILNQLWSHHGLTIAHSHHLVGNFNMHLMNRCFLFADEAFFAGDRKMEGVLKNLITSHKLFIEGKGLQPFEVSNHLKIFMATNHDYAVPATEDERRFCVIDVSESKIQDFEYFDQLYGHMENPEFLSAIMYYVLNKDLSGFNIRKVPESQGLKDQRYESLDSRGVWLHECIENGHFGGDYGEWAEVVSSDFLYTSYLEWCYRTRKSEYKIFNKVHLGRFLSRFFEKKRDQSENNNRKFILGNREKAMENFIKIMKI